MDENCIETAILNYLNHCRFEKGLDSKTIKAYQIDLLQFSAFIQKKGNFYRKENLQAYIAYLHGHYKIKSVKRKIASLKAFFNYLEYEEIIGENPFSKIRVKLHEPFLLPRTIPLTSIDTLLRCAYQQLVRKRKLHMNIALAYVMLLSSNFSLLRVCGSQNYALYMLKM